MRSLLILFATINVLNGMSQDSYFLVTGTYTNGKSEGIYIHEFNTKTGDAKPLNVVKGIKNPSYLAVSPDEKYVYAVSEQNNAGNGGRVYAYSFDKLSANMQEINSQPSGGDDPCYISVDNTGKWVVVGNYSSGSLKAMRVMDGRLQEDSRVIRHTGHSINKERQEKPHVHCTYFDANNKYLYVPDLGIDKVMIYRFNVNNGDLFNVGSAGVELGSGPRHIIISPNGKYAYLMEEIKGRVSVFSVSSQTGTLDKIQTISSAAVGFTGDMGSADIHLTQDGKFLYASNRGEANDIAIFSVDGLNGTLTKIGNQPVLGIAPRNFSFDPTENFLLVANMNSNEVVIFARNSNNGLLTDTGKRISIPTPVCLKWIGK